MLIFLYLSLKFDTLKAHSLLCGPLSSVAVFSRYLFPLWQDPFLLLPPRYCCASLPYPLLSSFPLCMHCLGLLFTYSDVLDLELVRNHRFSVLLASSFCLSHRHLKVSNFKTSRQVIPPHPKTWTSISQGQAHLTSHSTWPAIIIGPLETCSNQDSRYHKGPPDVIDCVHACSVTEKHWFKK